MFETREITLVLIPESRRVGNRVKRCQHGRGGLKGTHARTHAHARAEVTVTSERHTSRKNKETEKRREGCIQWRLRERPRTRGWCCRCLSTGAPHSRLTRAGLADNLGAQGSGLRARQTKRSPHAPWGDLHVTRFLQWLIAHWLKALTEKNPFLVSM